ncbi:MAG: SOS response-associated peptidase [Candidatus Kapaibacterium sp.]
MCGRFALTATTKDIERLVPAIQIKTDVSPMRNISPTSFIAIITDEHGYCLDRAKWGLIPSWAKDISISNKLFNARSETIHEKPSFKKSFEKRRCLIPATEFFEWKKDGNSKQPYSISMKDDSIFCFGGIWDIWRKGDETIYSTTIITTLPNLLVADIHDRMPVIIRPDMYETWIGKDTDQEMTFKLMKPFDESFMKAVPVDDGYFKIPKMQSTKENNLFD